MTGAKRCDDRQRQIVVENDGAHEVAPGRADLDHLLEHRKRAEHAGSLREAALLGLIDTFDGGLGVSDDRVTDIRLEDRDATGDDLLMHDAAIGDWIECFGHGAFSLNSFVRDFKFIDSRQGAAAMWSSPERMQSAPARIP